MSMIARLLCWVSALLICTPAWAGGADSKPVEGRTPILVELFTSEGCSSCPPADRFLEKLDHQPISGAEMIVLSEHVDYWNDIGWKDPYSSGAYSQRQQAYAKHFGPDTVYTPEMVVDGSSQFVGSNAELADKALRKALSRQKLPIRVSSVSAVDPNYVGAHVEVGPLKPAYSSHSADVYAVVALNRAESQVSKGENAGRRLTHVAVVTSLTKIGEVQPGQSYSEDIHLKLESHSQPENRRMIVFVQESRVGRVLGAALIPLGTAGL
jgi:hypothetical protein